MPDVTKVPVGCTAACVAPASLCTKDDLANHTYEGCCCKAGWTSTGFVGYWAPTTIKGCGHEGYNGWSVAKEGPAAAFCCTAIKHDDDQAGSSPLVRWQIAPPTSKVRLDASSSVLDSSTISIAMMRGECEHRQIVLQTAVPNTELRNVAVTNSNTPLKPHDEPTGSVAWSFKQVGYVFCHHCPMYWDSGGGWRPDVLLESNGSSASAAAPVVVVPRVLASTTQPIWVSVCTSTTAAAGNRTGHLTVSGTSINLEANSDGVLFSFVVQYTLEIWDIVMPPLNSKYSMNTSFCFCKWSSTLEVMVAPTHCTLREHIPARYGIYYQYGARLTGKSQTGGDAHTGMGGLANYYDHYWSGEPIQRKFYRFLADHRTPADEMYRQFRNSNIDRILNLDQDSPYTCDC